MHKPPGRMLSITALLEILNHRLAIGAAKRNMQAQLKEYGPQSLDLHVTRMRLSWGTKLSPVKAGLQELLQWVQSSQVITSAYKL